MWMFSGTTHYDCSYIETVSLMIYSSRHYFHIFIYSYIILDGLTGFDRSCEEFLLLPLMTFHDKIKQCQLRSTLGTIVRVMVWQTSDFW